MRTFDIAERRTWTGRAQAYADSFARLCAHPVPALLDAVRPATRLLDVGCGPGTVAAAADDMTVVSIDADGTLVLSHRALLAHGRTRPS